MFADCGTNQGILPPPLLSPAMFNKSTISSLIVIVSLCVCERERASGSESTIRQTGRHRSSHSVSIGVGVCGGWKKKNTVI